MSNLLNRLRAALAKCAHPKARLAFIALLCGTAFQSAAAQDALDRHGVIEVGSSGVKVQAYDLSQAEARAALTAPDAAEGLRYHVFAERSLTDHDELDVNPYRPENVERTADAVKHFIDYLYSEHGVRRERTYVVGSSGVGRLEHATDIATAIAERTGRQIDFITPTREGALNFNWITPLYRRGQALVIDIGSNNVSASYRRSGGDDEHSGFELVELGSKSLLDAVVAQNGGVPPNDLGDRLGRYRTDTLTPKIYKAAINHPGAANRQRVYLLGGIVWALAAHERPDQVGEEWVSIRAGDIGAFYDRIADGDAFTPSADALELIQDGGRRDDALAEVARVSDVFTADQLLAGAVLLLGVNDALALNDRDAVFFSRVGRGGWRSQYLLETVAQANSEP